MHLSSSTMVSRRSLLERGLSEPVLGRQRSQSPSANKPRRREPPRELDLELNRRTHLTLSNSAIAVQDFSSSSRRGSGHSKDKHRPQMTRGHSDSVSIGRHSLGGGSSHSKDSLHRGSLHSRDSLSSFGSSSHSNGSTDSYQSRDGEARERTESRRPKMTRVHSDSARHYTNRNRRESLNHDASSQKNAQPPCRRSRDSTDHHSPVRTLEMRLESKLIVGDRRALLSRAQSGPVVHTQQPKSSRTPSPPSILRQQTRDSEKSPCRPKRVTFTGDIRFPKEKKKKKQSQKLQGMTIHDLDSGFPRIAILNDSVDDSEDEEEEPISGFKAKLAAKSPKKSRLPLEILEQRVRVTYMRVTETRFEMDIGVSEEDVLLTEIKALKRELNGMEMGRRALNNLEASVEHMKDQIREYSAKITRLEDEIQEIDNDSMAMLQYIKSSHQQYSRQNSMSAAVESWNDLVQDQQQRRVVGGSCLE